MKNVDRRTTKKASEIAGLSREQFAECVAGQTIFPPLTGFNKGRDSLVMDLKPCHQE